MKLSFYFEVHPRTKSTDLICASTIEYNGKIINATRYRIDVEIPDPAQPDKIISGEVTEVIDHHSV